MRDYPNPSVNLLNGCMLNPLLCHQIESDPNQCHPDTLPFLLRISDPRHPVHPQ